ncbi:T9SS type A sorting domain-containing protein [Spirosoma endophyticum]|uniref:Por secretion system C-terminal sorting domain-containing protein n=1 Tax=Spirosoma endophyticum TaxID=662367 RepID=A0A1I1RAE9_9BACT|nr:T9SS type A sorting domain-containing protein [Spirosoma endophyticum]SFD31235.1 Por secretion system C-terminal sorting domain-containing protein [Spirosoma endophyticum]
MGITLHKQPYIVPFAERLLRGFLLVCCILLASTAIAQTPLSLPFFEDFSTASGQPGLDRPEAVRWQPGSGVYINNTMAINQPTVNVASFDGLMANGLPYVQNNPLAQGYTDTLTSLPINMAGLSARDSVYISFYWQAKGLGEAPDPGDSLSRQAADSLTLQFLDQTGVWKTVWAKDGGIVNNNFFQVFVPIRDAAYFHAGFAFRFRTFGKVSGPFDTWNLDYIYLNKGRSVNDRFVKDVAMRQALTPFLKRYTAMPLSQYVMNPAAETADSVNTDSNNLFNNFNFTTFHFTVRDEVSGRVVQNDPQTSSLLIPSLSSQGKSAKPAPVTGFGSATKAMLRYKFDLLTTDDQNPSIPGINLRRNDTISAVAALADYYAYDDGTWEYAQQIRQQEQIAVRFILNKPDAMSGVRACIIPFTTNQTGQSFVINVYSNRAGKPGAVLYRQSFTIKYPAYRNGFVEFPFTKNVSVRDTFFVGYQQVSSSDTTYLRLGFDKNSRFGAQIFYNGGTNWEQNLASSSLNVQGAFLLRPVMGAKVDSIVTAIPEPTPLAPLQAYPNPTSGLIRWDESRLTRLEVMNSSGRMLLSLEPARGQQTADLSYLPDGFYLLRFWADQRTVVQKLIIQH